MPKLLEWPNHQMCSRHMEVVSLWTKSGCVVHGINHLQLVRTFSHAVWPKPQTQD